MSKRKLFSILYPELVIFWNINKNFPLMPQDVSIAQNKKIWWVCENGHEFERKIYNFVRAPMCHICNSLGYKYPEIAKLLHTIKNDNINPYDIPSGSGKKMWWQYPNAKDHEWEATVLHVVSGTRCSCDICFHNKLKTQEKFIADAINIHGNKYNYDCVNYKTAIDKVKIYCNKCCYYFEQIANTHLSGAGCRKCGLASSRSKQALGVSKFIERANKKHNNKYNYDNVISYTNKDEKIIISCSVHGNFLQTPGNHLRGAGCPLCVGSVSKAEIEWLDYLNVPKEFRQKTLIIEGKLFRPDAINEKDKIIYEFNGDFWHGNPNIYNQYNINPWNYKTFGQLYKNTIDKENKLKQAGYTVISIWESEWNKFKKQGLIKG